MYIADGDILDLITEVAQTLPTDTLMGLCQILEGAGQLSPSQVTSQLPVSLPAASSRTQVGQLLQRVGTTLPNMTTSQLAWALRAAAHTDRTHRRRQKLDLVWSGPTLPRGTHLRRTDQALLEVINLARRELILVTFAAYLLPHLQRALMAALDRGVAVTLLLESHYDSGGKLSKDASASFDPMVRSRVRQLVWPLEQRPRDEQGRAGVLHAKFALADAHHLFISSANLTHHAHHLNMELGILITGGDLPIEVNRHVGDLMRAGVLVVGE